MNNVAPVQPSGSLSGISVVDADTHISEWPDLWTSRAPAKYKHRMPQLKLTDGRLLWVIDGDKLLNPGSNFSAIKKDGSKAVGIEFAHWGFEDITAGAHSVTARLRYMNEAGIQAQIAYPNVLGFGGQAAMMVDPELRLMSTQIYNDAMAELQAESSNRIFPMALLPWWDIEEAVKETRRCAKMGLRGVNTNSDPQEHKLPTLGGDFWNPLWEACIELDMPVNFHIGASDTSMTWFGHGVWPTFDLSSQLAFGSTMLFMGNARVLSNIILSTFLERFPQLKLVSVESGVGYLPYLLECLEYQMLEAGIKFNLTPLEIFRRQIYACSWFERREFVHSARSLGIDNILFETDYPHPTCLYPNALEYVEKAARAFTPKERVKIFGGNAARIYKLPLISEA
jgi:predicted TIM-barrel fold metal-dependent hydrolase